MDPIKEKVDLTLEAEVRNRLIGECINNVNSYFQSRAWEIFSNKFRSMNIKLPPDLIGCKMCEEPMTAHYFEREKKIIVCANHTTDEEFEYTITHEMVHLFDDARAELDFLNPMHIACSEIRATNLSGECKQDSWFKGFNNKKKYTDCVQKRAMGSLIANRKMNLDKDKAEEIVANVWDVCFYDYEPFSMDEAKKKLAGKKY